MSLLHDAVRVESLTVSSRFRTDFYDCLTVRADALFELADAVLCTDGPVRSLVDLALAPEHRSTAAVPVPSTPVSTADGCRPAAAGPGRGAAAPGGRVPARTHFERGHSRLEP